MRFFGTSLGCMSAVCILHTGDRYEKRKLCCMFGKADFLSFPKAAHFAVGVAARKSRNVFGLFLS